MWVRVYRCVRTGGDQRGCVAQMAFGGHHAKAASDEVQKKLQEEAAMADEIEKSLVKATAGMNIRGDDDNYSSDDEKYRPPGYKPAPDDVKMLAKEPDDEKPEWMYAYAAGVMETVKDLPKEQIVSMYIDSQMKLKKAKTEGAAGGSPYKMTKYDPIHEKIVKDTTVIRVQKDMQDLQKTNPLALWWVVQWGEEYLARFRNGPDDPFAPYSKSDLSGYQTWTNKKDDRPSMKVLAGMTATTKADSQPASGSGTPAPAKKSAVPPFV